MASATQTPQTVFKQTHRARNKDAGRLLASWRIDKGLSPEALSWEMSRAGLGHISGRQIRRIENDGVIPTPRTMFGLATFFETTPTAIWYSTRSRGRA